MIRALLTIGLIVGPVPGFALSCQWPDLAETYHQLDSEAQQFHLALGRLDIDDSFVRPERPDTFEEPTFFSVQAVFYGKLGSKLGFNTDFTGAVTLQVRCALHYCGGLPPEQKDLLMFLEITHDGLHLTRHLCEGRVFWADEKTIGTAKLCLSGHCP